MATQYGAHTTNTADLMTFQKWTEEGLKTTKIDFIINCSSSMDKAATEGKSRFNLAKAYINALCSLALKYDKNISLYHNDVPGSYAKDETLEDARDLKSQLDKLSTTDAGMSISEVVKDILDEHVANLMKPLTLIVFTDDLLPDTGETMRGVLAEIQKKRLTQHSRQWVRLQLVLLLEAAVINEKTADLDFDATDKAEGELSVRDLVDIISLRTIEDLGGIESLQAREIVLAEAEGFDMMDSSDNSTSTDEA